MVAEWMMRVRDADLRIGAIVLLARELECHDARDVGLKRQDLQIEHEFRVIGKFRGDSDGPLEVWNLWIRSRALSYLALIAGVALAILLVVLVVRRRRRRHGRRPSEEEMESIRENRRMMREQQREREREPRR